ncbi:MAG: hypothetical protein IKW87_03725 [Ruminococcus sp.]|nr:hypothetical protein [Ruminococcus sp.]
MSKKDIFNDPESELAERFSKDYPVLSRSEKERIFSLIRQKQGREAYDGEVTVTGVERRSGHAWQKFAGIAAVFALIVGIGGSTLVLHMLSVNGAERLAAAEQLTDDFLAAANLLTADVSGNPGSVCFYQYSTRNADWEGGDVYYTKVDDERFQSCADVVTFMEGLVTNEYMYELRQNGGEYFSSGLSELLYGSDETAPRLMTYCGQLYASRTGSSPVCYTTSPMIIESSSGGMTVRRGADVSLVFHIVRDGSDWKITDIERTGR